jgi:hypothetical protein
MSLRFEQYQALLRTREFLRDLMDSKKRPKRVSEINARAYRCLKHFPMLNEKGKPLFSQDEFTED